MLKAKFTVHPAERKRSPAIVGSVCCSCCCCCSCCLHTVGSLAGAAIGTAVAIKTARNRPQALQVVAVYWVSTLTLLSMLIAISLLTKSLLAILIIVLLLVPVLQLGASVITFVVGLIIARDRGDAMKTVGWITLVSTVLGAIGLGLLVLFLSVLIA